eukprot:2256642-Alexandrium_andersonii.AAC.1
MDASFRVPCMCQHVGVCRSLCVDLEWSRLVSRHASLQTTMAVLATKEVLASGDALLCLQGSEAGGVPRGSADAAALHMR